MALESLPKIAPALFSAEQDLIQIYNKKSDTFGTINASLLGGSTPPSGVSGAIQFSTGSAFGSDSANLFWDNTNKRLGVNTNAPNFPVDVVGEIRSTTQVSAGASGINGVFAVRRTSDGNVIGTFAANANEVVITEFTGQGGRLDTGYATTALKWIGTGSQPRVGIGFNGSVLATTHIKGSGSTSATTSLLVQNSAGTTQLYMRDDGVMVFANQVQGPLLRASSNLACSNFQTQNYAGLWMSVDDSVNVGNVTIGNGTTTLGAKLGIKGAGSTSATTSLLVQNSSGTAALTITDDRNALFSSSVTANRLIASIVETNYINTVGNAYSALQTNPSNGNVRFYQFVSIGTTSDPAASAALDVVSTTRGFLPPRMTDAQIRAIASPAEGLVAYNTTINHLCAYQGGVWVKFNHSPM